MFLGVGGGKSVECASALCVIVYLWVFFLSQPEPWVSRVLGKNHIAHKFVNRADAHEMGVHGFHHILRGERATPTRLMGCKTQAWNEKRTNGARKLRQRDPEPLPSFSGC